MAPGKIARAQSGCDHAFPRPLYHSRAPAIILSEGRDLPSQSFWLARGHVLHFTV
jgi:hypothetical protein